MIPEHMSKSPIERTDGFFIAVCECGWESGPLPSEEDCTDALMDHAYEAGYAAGTASAGDADG